ncbi:restriction endonuclease subunit S [Sphingobium sp. SA916]|uniref:restriction endonuclease subunit S n=1 Tax=Sphingobium sp. SA916 TaxID=1851207 RepID=UPI000C9F3F5C|nr:restriction endonuclease subunit S [Sphingobium sp. SA916]PNP97526.1 hypothetical protein A8G00_21995 [Sphingobium sp. SA916]
MSFPAYQSYQETGIEWLGQVPADWRQVPFWALFRRVKRSGYQDEQLLSVYRDYGIVRKADRGDNFNKPSEDLSAYQLVEEGDLAINKMKAWQGSVGVSEHRGIVSPAYFVYRPLHTHENRFLHYLLRSAEYTAGYLSLSKGIRVNQWDLDPTYHSRMPVLLPSRNEQVSIAAFLDRETAKIDALIEEQRRLIALLKEKRQAVISKAVTKGLDPHAPMKHSGIEWLGEVPAHWMVAPLGCRYEVQLGRMLNSERTEGNELRPYLRVADVQWDTINTTDLPLMDFPPEARARYRLKEGDLLINEGGSYVGRSAIWRGDIDECYYQKALHRVRAFDPRFDTAEFLLFVMEWATKYGIFVAGGNQTTIDHLTAEQLRSYRFAFPPRHEQDGIATHLRTAIAGLENLRATADKAIELLSERRAALISAAVTGKIDVRGKAQVLPFPIDRARARGLIAAEIIERSAHQATFGRVKFQKIAFLAEAHVGISELAGSYTREAAGPLDRALIEEMESGARSIAGIEHEQPGGAGTTVSYRLGQQRGAHRQELAQWLGEDRTAKLDKLIGDFAALSTKGAEAVATLYGVWNDLLSEGASPSDDEIIGGFLNDWHREKRAKFRASELPEWLGWMRRHGLVPTGSGPTTTTGRLFV